jgi:hypothetical protein
MAGTRLRRLRRGRTRPDEEQRREGAMSERAHQKSYRAVSQYERGEFSDTQPPAFGNCW